MKLNKKWLEVKKRLQRAPNAPVIPVWSEQRFIAKSLNKKLTKKIWV